MEVSVVRYQEAEPSSYPNLIGYDEEGDQLDPIIPDRSLWRRIENYICLRHTPRQAIWSIVGPGTWEPHLSPLSAVSVDVWSETDYTWSAVTPVQTALGGFDFAERKTYRITGTLGDTSEVPQLIVMAYQRLAEYCEDTALTPAGASSYSNRIGDGLDETIERSPAWLARALQNSGCADLLRSFRRI